MGDYDVSIQAEPLPNLDWSAWHSITANRALDVNLADVPKNYAAYFDYVANALDATDAEAWLISSATASWRQLAPSVLSAGVVVAVAADGSGWDQLPINSFDTSDWPGLVSFWATDSTSVTLLRGVTETASLIPSSYRRSLVRALRNSAVHGFSPARATAETLLWYEASAARSPAAKIEALRALAVLTLRAIVRGVSAGTLLAFLHRVPRSVSILAHAFVGVAVDHDQLHRLGHVLEPNAPPRSGSAGPRQANGVLAEVIAA